MNVVEICLKTSNERAPWANSRLWYYSKGVPSENMLSILTRLLNVDSAHLSSQNIFIRYCKYSLFVDEVSIQEKDNGSVSLCHRITR